MKTRTGNLYFEAVLIAALALIPAGWVSAQTFTVLHTFTGDFTGGSDGGAPGAGLILSGNTLYGTTVFGGSAGAGTVFAVNTDGTGFTNLYDFAGGSGGGYPSAGLILSGNTLYGTAGGGSSGKGMVFKVNTDGTSFTTLHSFTGSSSDGANPSAGLVLSNNVLYGTTENGGNDDLGTVFKVNTNGTGFTTLHSFTYLIHGRYPKAGLVLSGNTLYGTTSASDPGAGTVFAVNTDGTGFTDLHTFPSGMNNGTYVTNSDGGDLRAGLILSGNTLYGTAYRAGGSGYGTVFKVNTDGTGFTNLHNFTSSVGDGAFPRAGLIFSGSILYGTTEYGGSSGYGTMFAVNTDGTGFTNLYSFTGIFDPSYTNSDGAYPQAGLILSGNTLYGTASDGGSSSDGTIFKLFSPPVNRTPVVANPIPGQTNTYGGALNFTFAANTFTEPDAGQTLTYTATNLPTDITFDGPSRTFSGTNTSIVTNTVTITATDNGTPPLSTNTTFQFFVRKAQLTGRPVDKTNYYGSPTFFNPFFDVAYTGFVLGESLIGAGGVITLDTLPGFSTTATAASPVGAYPITLSGGADDHYQLTFQSGTLTVAPAPLVVVSYNACRLVGESNPPVSGRLVGLRNNDPITVGSFSTTATLASPAGSYPITGVVADPNHRLTNYGLSYLQGALTVLPYDYLYEIVHSFGQTNEFGDVDPAGAPAIGVTEGRDGRLYGIARGGPPGGPIFRLNKDGTGYRVMTNFVQLNEGGMTVPLVEGSNGVWFGVAPGSGLALPGKLIKVNADGTGLTIIHTFSESEGVLPIGPLLLSTNGVLYGISAFIYRIQQDGTGFGAVWQRSSDSEPAGLTAGLIEGRDGALYGTGFRDNNEWIAFKVQKDGTGMTILHSEIAGFDQFTPLTEGTDEMLYGVTVGDGFFYNGTIFRLGKDGSNFAVLHQFDSVSGDGSGTFGGSGVLPFGALLEGNDGKLYGTTRDGGVFGGGTAYRLNKDGTGYCILHHFASQSSVRSALIQGSDGAFYGTSEYGGANDIGTVFRLTPLVPPTLQIGAAGPGNVTISWSPHTPGLVLQLNGTLNPITWTNAPSGSTNPITLPVGAGARFFRLKR